MKRCLLLAFLFLLGLRHPAGAFPLETIRQANQDYLQGDYAKAVAGYEQALKAGWDNGHLHYNLGNAYYQSGRLGPAVFHFLQARLRLPRDEDVAANLSTAIRRTEDLLEWESLSPLASVLFWLEDFNFWEHLQALFWLYLGLWATLVWELFRPGPRPRLVRRVLLGLGVVCLVSTLARWHLERGQPFGVVIPPSVEARTKDQGFSGTTFRLHEGTVVRILEQGESWVTIELPDGRKGWVTRDQLWISTHNPV